MERKSALIESLEKVCIPVGVSLCAFFTAIDIKAMKNTDCSEWVVFLGVLLAAEIVKMKYGVGKKGFVAIYAGILLLAIGIFITAHF